MATTEDVRPQLTGREAPLPDLVRAALALPLRRGTATTVVLAALVVLAETVGLATRLACRAAACAPWTARFDLDALGSVPRLLVTSVLAVAAVCCWWAVLRAGRHGAGIWWATLALGAAVLAAAKATSLHSVLEARLPDAQLLFLGVSLLGLTVAVVSGRWVRRGTRVAVVTWLALYALASVGLAAVSVVLAGTGTLAGDLASYVEETAEGLSAVGLLAAVAAQAREVSRRT
ncbi:hypothetical protein [Klenkia taihuensis]|uniref:Uncharacterized protein n=1 Tax=Klenkia taihuensis TaxID=1225127 RepID=A0A1I1NMJ3_9ACTN|nr:hypothetical protein [Klenkia taihuensis]GHE11841.1 hypothetical protein GCM10011381_27020 [Klenkia taihuensis]SFC98869.1 hypothetical protein SAMN05661030_2192 [Klenkia taihuensis]